jgi:hypothetical protein
MVVTLIADEINTTQKKGFFILIILIYLIKGYLRSEGSLFWFILFAVQALFHRRNLLRDLVLLFFPST